MQYLPKKDLIYALTIWAAPTIVLFLLLFNFSFTLLIIFILSFMLSFWLWNSTKYEITNGELCIRCWLFKKRVNIKDIEQVKKTKNIWASYALAVERLEITEKNKSKYYISPNNFEAFIAELKRYNAAIRVG